MRIRLLLLALVLVSPLGARAQVVSPLTGSTGAAAPAATPPPATTAPPRHARKTFAERFDAANTTHDGKLTLEQARAGHLRAVVRDFDQIDTTKRGYVTLDDIKTHQTAQRAARRAAKPTTASH